MDEVVNWWWKVNMLTVCSYQLGGYRFDPKFSYRYTSTYLNILGVESENFELGEFHSLTAVGI